MRYISMSERDTEALGEALGRKISTPSVVALSGDLGAGKTVFARGLARGLGVDSPVTSPTFALVHEHRGRLPLFHFDLYRLDGPQDLFDIGWDDYLGGGVCVVEWGDRAAGEMPPGTLTITIEADPEKTDRRYITYDHNGPYGHIGPEPHGPHGPHGSFDHVGPYDHVGP
ncbi:MAG: tRNA (adenosine(37)-N6)-threonylcarbamoyltransferase complex ATPase subunit type 1 TsaE [Oscillospiraceae bacterium]|nr:tRNA (adenosine(37)-N6)-threonylcarbamoyltransferase complex ATPase subunit type 1 TsaE [Oscillospiraceae bacterium]